MTGNLTFERLSEEDVGLRSCTLGGFSEFSIGMTSTPAAALYKPMGSEVLVLFSGSWEELGA